MPNHPSVERVLSPASQSLQAATGSGSLPRTVCAEYGIEIPKELIEQLGDLPEDSEIRSNLIALFNNPLNLKLKLKFGEIIASNGRLAIKDNPYRRCGPPGQL
jgi:hypothetical protein